MSLAQTPPLHPLEHDRIERERCPYCGEPGRMVERRDGLQIWRCVGRCAEETRAPARQYNPDGAT